jgi:diaminopimelate epimerase
MSKITFAKFQGAGNDFILIDDRALSFNPQLVSKLCHRRFGVGADGVILLQRATAADFRMRIYNADGSEAESCGNGLRCLVRYAVELGFPKRAYRIATKEKVVNAHFVGEKIAIDLGEVSDLGLEQIEGREVHTIHTGVPHAVIFTNESLDTLGPLIQNHQAFLPAKINVNVAQIHEGCIEASTYERGVGKTLSCGTGAAAVGFVAIQKFGTPNPVAIHMPGGVLKVQVEGSRITLIGDAVKVFDGFI